MLKVDMLVWDKRRLKENVAERGEVISIKA